MSSSRGRTRALSMHAAVRGLVAGLALVVISPSAGASLIARYEAEGNANDSVAARNGSLVNGATFGAGRVGAQAFSLDGASQSVSVPDNAVWTFGSAAFSVSVWANFDTVRAGIAGNLPNVFVGHDQGGGGQPKWVFFHDAVKPYFHVNTGGGDEFLAPAATFVPAAGEWHLYTVTRSGSTYTFYVDSTSLGTATGALSIPDANALLTFGQAESSGFLDGRLDDVRIYNHALSPAEVAALVPEPSSAVAIATLVALAAARRRRP